MLCCAGLGLILDHQVRMRLNWILGLVFSKDGTSWEDKKEREEIDLGRIIGKKDRYHYKFENIIFEHFRSSRRLWVSHSHLT